jgi:hypothetical protein
MAEKIRVTGLADLSAVSAAIRNQGFPCNVTIAGAGRSLPQNALAHRWYADIATFFIKMGKSHFASGKPINEVTMKESLKLTFLGEEPIESTNLLTGEIRTRLELRKTSELDKGGMHNFMTLIDSWAQEHGIYLPHPEDSEYMKMRVNMGCAA